MRAWSSPGMLNLRRDLDAQAEEKLRAQLRGFLAGELSQGAWLKTLSVITEARRAADRLAVTQLHRAFTASDEWRYVGLRTSKSRSQARSPRTRV
jgi:hypothetical protein